MKNKWTQSNTYNRSQAALNRLATKETTDPDSRNCWNPRQNEDQHFRM